MPLDFSKLDKIAYRGFEDAAQAEAKDALIERGFTLLEDAKTPFDAPQAPNKEKPTPAPETLSKRQLKPFVGLDGADYRKFYRLVCNFQEKYTPPRLTDEYWESAANELSEIADSNGNNEFLIQLLVTVYGELERQYALLEAREKADQ